MGLGSSIQKMLVKMAFANKEKLFSLFLEKLNKEYYNNRLEIAQKIMMFIPSEWKKTATDEETAYAIDLTKEYIEKMYGAIQAMQQMPGSPHSPRVLPRI